jgi:galactose mutarotase-like enzyme
MGAKIVSIYDKQATREWLVPPPEGRAFQPVEYGSVFIKQDMSGWDEMMPTIDESEYPIAGAYQGAHLPDHGEVWALPWTITDVQQDALSLAVDGKALPYHFVRMIRVLDDHTMRFEYAVSNTGNGPIIVLWTAHPQFMVDTDTRIVLPANVKTVRNILNHEMWGEVGALHDWPNATTVQGEAFALDRVRGKDAHSYRKFYLPPDQPAAWAGLIQETSGQWLRLSWDTATVPYLGLWYDEGYVSPIATMAFEPSTGYYDRLPRAWENQRVTQLQPQQAFAWHLDIEIGKGAEILRKD